MRVLLFSLCAIVLLFGVARETCAEPCRMQWSFRTASPVSAPATVAPNGHVYVTSQEGYLYALRADGGFLWSYAVNAALLDSAAVDAAGHVYVASSQGNVYSFLSDGTPRWVFHSPVKPIRSLRIGSRGAAHFVSGERVYALSSKAGLLWGFSLGAEMAGELVEAENGAPWLGTVDGRVYSVPAPYRAVRWPLPQPDPVQSGSAQPSATQVAPARVVAVTKNRVAVQSASRLFGFDPRGALLWSRDEVLAAAPAGPGLLGVVSAQKVQWLDFNDGSSLAQVSYQGERGARPAFDAERAYLPHADGRLSVVTRAGHECSCVVASAALFTPRIDERRQQVIVTSGDGNVVAVRWE